ncbi:MAG: 1,4-dihydroxy-2-naphthoate polyprenyltransferase [Ignavibacterium sp.]|nr:1,4-dihydroxy-2-naphthoate polyprenyltransferase [Ignavibacterium sp.]MDW8375415.1 1,4-dihydroxy-2-naphthoate polyprenyltransferase [Ignavibacteriales bacterium]
MNSFNKLNYWILASRPKTLAAAIVPVMVGSALAIKQGKFFFSYSLIALLCSILIQIGTNFTNDLFDYLKGADTKKRKGPLRVISAGLISVKEMKLGIIIVYVLTFILGLYLVFSTDMVILIIGILSIVAGILYTAGPYPLAYNGLGDLFVFIFFGIIGTMGTYYLHHQEFTILSFLSSIPVGALITNILIVNNYRDIEEDKLSGKKTLAVKFGKKFSRLEYIFFLSISLLIPVVFYLLFDFNYAILLPILSIPISIKLINMIFKYQGEELNKTLELSAKYSALYGLLFSIGLVL